MTLGLPARMTTQSLGRLTWRRRKRGIVCGLPSRQSGHNHEWPILSPGTSESLSERESFAGSFILNDTGCHFGLSLHDGSRTTADRCHQEYTQNSEKPSAAVLEVTEEELKNTGAFVIVDSPDGITFAHVDALYKHSLSNKLRKDAGRALMTAANRRGPVYIPKQ